MARVVQRRKSPPYALIVFVFLFLIASTLFVLQYMKVDELEKKSQASIDALKQVASSTERSQPEIQNMVRTFKKEGHTVYAQLSQSNSTLTQKITGTTTDPEDAIKKADDLFKAIGSNRGLIQEVRDARKKHATALSQIADLKKQVLQAASERDTKQETITKLQAKFASDVQKLNQTIESIKATGQQRETAHQGGMDSAKKEWGLVRNDLNKKIADLVKNVEEQKRDIKHQKTMYQALEKKFEGYRPKIAPNVARKPDGKILRVVEEADRCYINLGLKDRVIPGLTFSIYSQAGIPQTGEGKGKIIVTNVSDTISECRISMQDKKDPILANDLIANLVFDVLRQYTFVVEGEFDLHGRGEATQDGAKEVRLLIQRFGGKNAKEVEIDTDFVVMGEAPLRPAKPKESAPPQVWEIYRKQVEIFDRYHGVRQLAQSLRIPILNASRFIAFMGYTPLEEEDE
jgi:hypothetical protein